MNRGLMIQGPLESAKGAVAFDCIDTIARNLEAANPFVDYVVISTWRNSSSQSLERLIDIMHKEFGPSRCSLILCDPPTKTPLVRLRINPSRNIYLQAETSYRGLGALMSEGLDTAIKVRTDMEFSGPFFRDLAVVNQRHNSLLVKAFRPDAPWFFGDGVLSGSVLDLKAFFEKQLREPQVYVNTHFEHFRVLLEMYLPEIVEDVGLPSEFQLEKNRISREHRSMAIRLWEECLRLLPAKHLYPHYWRGVEVSEGPSFETINWDNLHESPSPSARDSKGKQVFSSLEANSGYRQTGQRRALHRMKAVADCLNLVRVRITWMFRGAKSRIGVLMRFLRTTGKSR